MPREMYGAPQTCAKPWPAVTMLLLCCLISAAAIRGSAWHWQEPHSLPHVFTQMVLEMVPKTLLKSRVPKSAAALLSGRRNSCHGGKANKFMQNKFD